MLANTRRISSYSVYLILSFGYGLGFTTMTTYNGLYQFDIAHLNALQLVLVGTVLETVCFICQVPTGVLADLYSRRLSLIFGVLVVGAAFVLEGLIPTFVAIMIAQGLYGVGACFMGGAEEAWITDEVGEERAAHAFLRGSQISQVGNVLGALLGAVLATVRLNLPVVIGGGLIVLLGILLVFIMPESGFQQTPKEERQSWRGLADTFRNGLRAAWRTPMLLLILCVTLFYGLASEGFDRLDMPHLQADFVVPALGPLQPIVWFALIALVSNLLVLGVTELVQRRLNTNSQRTLIRALLVLTLVGMLGLLVFAFSGNFFLAIAAFWCVSVFRGVRSPLFNTWLVRNSEARVRATLVSLDGQMDAIGQITGGPPVGYLGTVFSLRIALASLSAILAPVLLLYAAALRRVKGEQVGQTVEEEIVTPLS